MRTFPCPVCGVELKTHAVGDRSLPICDACGGAWLDNATTQQVVRGTLSAEDKEIATWADHHATGLDHPAPAPVAVASYDDAYRGRANIETGRPCPECGAPMSTSTLAAIDVTLDVCAAHGTWFDASELLDVAKHFERKSAADDAAAAAFGKKLGDVRMKETAAYATHGMARYTIRLLIDLLL